ncbi:Alpha/beta hydrolase fold-1 [Xylariomycetidae sp. FL2044]|nr:Alpha/beta hydrolase fold-1 [Xylariomycetidae sp. FL2044]
MASTRPIFVFVPGACTAPSFFNHVTSLLRRQGYICLTPALAVASNDENLDPELDHFDDVKAIHAEVLPHFDEGAEAIIVDHSYGCLPGTAAIENQTVSERKARGLKGGFVALVRAAGGAVAERGLNLMGNTEPMQFGPMHVVHHDRRLFSFDVDKMMESGWSDLSPEARKANELHVLKYMTTKTFATLPQFAEKEITIPKWYIVCDEDKAASSKAQEKFAEIGRFDHVIHIPAGHCPFISMPDRIVEILLDAVKNLQ